MGVNDPTRGGAPVTGASIAAKPQEGPKLGRRALLVTAGVGAAAVATPFVIEQGAKLAGTEVGNLLHSEVGNLEGIAIDEAIAAAELTRKAVQIFVLPLANFLATLSGDALQVLLATLQGLRNLIGLAHVDIGVLDGMIGVINQWHTNVSLLPISLGVFANADITGAENYLKALKTKINSNTA